MFLEYIVRPIVTDTCAYSPADSPNCCSGSHNTPETCPPSGTFRPIKFKRSHSHSFFKVLISMTSLRVTAAILMFTPLMSPVALLSGLVTPASKPTIL